MKRSVIVCLAVALMLCGGGKALAWGRGGGFHAGGFAAGGFRAGGFSAGGYRGFDAGGYHAAAVGAVGGYRGFDAGGYHAAAVGAVGGYRGFDAGGYHGAAVGGYHAGAVGVAGAHVGVAGDLGFGRVADVGRLGYVGVGNVTHVYSSGVLAARGVAVRGGFYRYGVFNNGWWGAHPLAWRPAGWAAGAWWAATSWGALNTWWGWTTPPLYYNYGDNIVYQNNEVVVNGQPEATAAQYYDQAADLAQTAPTVEKKSDEWKPLGVFSLVQGEQSEPNAVFQLAVNQAGAIRGNYTSILDGTTLPVHGAVNQKTQRAAWTVGDNKDTVYDTGIYNLTKDEAPLLIHFGKDRTQEWLLVRMQEKDAEAPPAAPPEETPPPPAPAGAASASVMVRCPADAQIWFDGTLTTQTGADRSYNTSPLQNGQPYYYTIRARWTNNGTPVEQTRKVSVRAGQTTNVAFPGS